MQVSCQGDLESLRLAMRRAAARASSFAVSLVEDREERDAVAKRLQVRSRNPRIYGIQSWSVVNGYLSSYVRPASLRRQRRAPQPRNGGPQPTKQRNRFETRDFIGT
jgi:hypothetical protein